MSNSSPITAERISSDRVAVETLNSTPHPRLPDSSKLRHVVGEVFGGDEVVGPVVHKKCFLRNRDAVETYWASKNFLLPDDALFRDVFAPDNTIVGAVVWSPAQPYVWSMRFASPC